MDQRRGEQAVPPDRRIRARKAKVASHPDPVVHDENVAPDRDKIGARLEEAHVALEPVREPDVVGVERSDVSAPRTLEELVPASGDTSALREADEPEAFVTEGLDDRRSSIGRAVVDDEQLQARERLPEDARQSGADMALVITCRDENGYERCRRRSHKRSQRTPRARLEPTSNCASTPPARASGEANSQAPMVYVRLARARSAWP